MISKYITNVIDSNNKYIETWYFGMIINNTNEADIQLKPRNIYYMDNKTNITKIVNITVEIINLFEKMNKECKNERS